MAITAHTEKSERAAAGQARPLIASSAPRCQSPHVGEKAIAVRHAADQALDHARRAVVEGLTIVERAQQDYRFEGRHGPGPREREWQLCKIGQPPSAEPEPPPIYHLDDSDRHNIRAVRTMLAMAKLTRKPRLKNAAYRDSGTYLQRLRRGRDQTEWAEIVQRECRLSTRRAYQLVATSSAEKPLAELRSEGAARSRKYHRIKASRREHGEGRREMARKTGNGRTKNPIKIDARKKSTAAAL
jgi:hypothetical protein